MKSIKSFFNKDADSLIDKLYDEMTDSHDVSREEFRDIINCILHKRNFAVYGYDNLQTGPKLGAFCFIKDDKDKIFLDVVSDYTRSVVDKLK